MFTEGTDRRVSFDTRDDLGDKIDKLTVVMSKLVLKHSHERKPIKPHIYRSRGQNRPHGQGGHQGRLDNRNRGYSTNNNTKQSYRGNRFRGTSGGTIDRIVGKVIGKKGMVTTIEIGIGQGKESLQEIMGETEALAMTGPDQDPKPVLMGIE